LNRNKENYEALKNNLSNLNDGWAVKGIEIDGWASPEGEDLFNTNLSKDRANTAKKYIEAKIRRELRKKNNGFAFKSVKDVPVTTVANGPDWNGFMKAVQNSDIKDRAAIVNVVNSVPENQRESEITKMIRVYPEIATKILPALRRAVIKVNAFEPKKTDAEILQMATSPDYAKLSVPELLYAATLTKDLNTKAEIYKNLSTKEPSCWRAVANGGAVETAMGNYDEAKSLLMKAENMNPKSAEVENSLGILNAKMGNNAAAVKNFTKAQELGADENYNLGIMNITEGNYQQAVNLLNGYKCDYNLGLAQLLSGNYSAASSTLQCAPETANTDYLLAVVNARQDNKSGMLNYLTKAIKMNGSLAAKAAQDREFIKYFNEPDFKALVNAK
jgi:tetratricopeptide (TPR) repeat protein